MYFEAIASHFCLLNFAVSAVLSFQSSRVESNLQGSLGKIALVLFMIGAGSASLALIAHGIDSELSLFSARWLILAVGLSWLAVAARIWLRILSIFVYAAPLMTLIMIFQFFVPGPNGQRSPMELSHVFLAFHIAGATMGQVLALAASLVSVVYLWQQRVLKKKLLEQLTPGVPALDLLEKILVSSLWAGFLFLTAALLSGTVYFRWFYEGQINVYGEKIAWAVTVWLWYLAALLARNFFNIPMKRVAQMSLLGFLLLAMTFFGMSFYQTGS